MHRHGDDLESTCRWRCQLLRRPSNHQLGPPDHPLLPFSLFFVKVISRQDSIQLQYGQTAIAVLIYLGIPLVAGVITRFAVMGICGRKFFENVFLKFFGPLALLGLLYT